MEPGFACTLAQGLFETLRDDVRIHIDMIHHFFLLLFVLLMPFGFLLLNRLWHLGRRTHHPVIRPLLTFLITVVLFFSAMFVRVYLVNNLPSVYEALNGVLMGRVGSVVWDVLVSMVVFLVYYSFLRAIETFHQSGWTRAIRIGYVSLFALFLCSQILSSVLPDQHFWNQVYDLLNPVLNYFGIFFLILLISLYRWGIQTQTGKKRVLAHSFAFCFLFWFGYDLLQVLSMDIVRVAAPEWVNTAAYISNNAYLFLTIGLCWFWVNRQLIPALNRGLGGLETEDEACAEQERIQLQGTLDLSFREAEIAQLILKGKSNKEIAVALDLSTSTVKNHIYNIYQKLDINSRFELIHLAGQLSNSMPC